MPILEKMSHTAYGKCLKIPTESQTNWNLTVVGVLAGVLHSRSDSDSKYGNLLIKAKSTEDARCMVFRRGANYLREMF